MIRRGVVAAALLVTIGALASGQAPASGPRHVEVKPSGEGSWQLLVDGQPFRVKGVGCNQATGAQKEDYIHLAKEMGANALRTWGDTTRDYLDRAEDEGLLVDVGVWINPVRGGSGESYQNPGFCAGLKNQILAYVRDLKDHPAVLSWNIGNEVFAYTDRDEERAALGHFLNDIIEAVHQEDPHHPVIYASASSKDLPNLQKYVPALDIVGVNIYGSLSPVMGWMRSHDYQKPILVTEFGPLGSWDQAKDANGLPYDPFDQIKASNYESLWRQISAEPGRCLGAFAFLLGDQRNQDSLTWYNVNFGERRREPYWALYTLYTGQRPPDQAPKISSFRVTPSTGVAPKEELDVTAVATDPDRDDLHFSYFITSVASDPLIVEAPKFYPADVRELEPGHALLRAPEDPGVYRVYVAAEDTHGNVAVANRSVEVDSGPPARPPLEAVSAPQK